jgi:aspartyl-tRNA(Asn)/glutamyl-tRNA(Gln) amidotransferase subunit B
MPEWEPVIGLEIHVQLKTRTKMFCRCENVWGEEENTRTCPTCLAHPGTLPVANKTAIEWAIKLGIALGCEIAPRALFHRKHYFYPDLPKGYQISQYDIPLASGGRFTLPTAEGDREIGIVRAHLEEDAAKTIHVGGAAGRIAGAEYSLVDFNRGGTLAASSNSSAGQSSSWGSRTRRWRRARSAATPTSPCAKRARAVSVRRPSSRT